LLQRLGGEHAKPLVLVLGQAAQGKSTLVADFLHKGPCPTAWVCLEPGDAQPDRFGELVIQALQTVLADGDVDRRVLVESPSHDTKAPAYCGKRLFGVLDHLSGPLNLVLDGLEAVMPDGGTLALIEEMIDNLPPSVRLFLISREMPPLRLQRLKIRQKALVITNDELAFNPDEIKAFFLRIHGLELADSAIEAMARRTGGWAGALVLIGQWFGRQPAGQQLEFSHAGLPQDLQREVFRYFNEEVFAIQPARTQSFLTRSAVLDVIDPAIAADLTGVSDSLGQLQDLVRRNLFLHAAHDPEKGWRFFFNPLFRDFLLSTLHTTSGAMTCRRLRIKAGKRYVTAHQCETAVPFFLKARAFDLAAAAIKKTGPDWLIKGRTDDLGRWIGQLPDEMVRHDPWLLYLITVTRRLTGGRRSIADFETALEGFTIAGDKRGQMLALAGRIETAVFAGHHGHELEPWLQRAEGMIRQMGETVYFAYAKAALWMQIGFGRIAGTGDLQKGLSACQSAYLLAKQIGSPALLTNTAVVGAMGQALAGEFTQAARSLERIAATVSQNAYPEYRTLKSIVSLDLALNNGDEPTARRHHDTIQRDIETFGLQFLYPAFIDASARLHLIAGQLAAAANSARHLTDVAVVADNAAYAGLSAKIEALIHYHGGRHDVAAAQAGMACRIFGQAGRTGLHFFQAKLIHGLAERHLGAAKRSERLLHEALAYFGQAPNPPAACQAQLGLALLKAASGEKTAMIGHLTAAFQTAEEKGYGYFGQISPRDLTEACMLAMQNDIAAIIAARFLFSGPVQKSGIVLEEVIRPLASQKPAVAPSLQRALHRVNLPCLKIQTFGGFAVQRGTIVIGENQWTGSRPRLLLKSLVVHGGRDVPKDILIDDLWPDSSPAAALQIFKVTLHRLRKILEPDMNPRFGSSYVHLKDNLVSLDPELCCCDVDTFIDLSGRAANCGPDPDPEHLQALIRRLDELVSGDFLPEEPYAPWIALRRKALRDHFINVMQKSADFFQRVGQWKPAAICFQAMIRCDPALETAHRGLMRCYARQGLRSQALKVYEDFKLAVASDLGALPDQATIDLYNEIHRGG